MPEARLAVFCDGDFWHGRDLRARMLKLGRGHNAEYWIAKIQANVRRDRGYDRVLRSEGWKVLRLWEGEITKDPEAAALRVLNAANAGRLARKVKRN